MSEDTIEVITHGTHCPNWPDPQTTEEWLAAQLVKDEVRDGDWLFDDDASGVWRCPFCRDAIFVFFDYGEIDFGVKP